MKVICHLESHHSTSVRTGRYYLIVCTIHVHVWVYSMMERVKMIAECIHVLGYTISLKEYCIES